jgi:hypothetical protein
MSCAARRFLSVALVLAILSWLGETCLSAVLDDIHAPSPTAWCESADQANLDRSDPRPSTPSPVVVTASIGTPAADLLRFAHGPSSLVAVHDLVRQGPRAPPA